MISLAICSVTIFVACVAGMWCLFRNLRVWPALLASGMIAASLLAVPAWLLHRVNAEPPSEADLSSVAHVTSTSCKKCHRGHYESWHRTYHRTMTQDPSAESVRGNFDNVRLEFDGLECRLFERNGEYFMDLVNFEWEARKVAAGEDPAAEPEPPRTTYRVDRVVGHHNMQVYLTLLPDGAYLTLPLVWHCGQRHWITLNGSFLRPPSKSLYASIVQWNDSCILCHTTYPGPGGVTDPVLAGLGRNWNSSVAELGISCEACHGAGEMHCRVNQNPVRRYKLLQSDAPDRTIVNPERLSKEMSVELCGRCHGKWSPKPELESEWLTSSGFGVVPGRERLTSKLRAPMPGVGAYGPDLFGYYWPDWSPRATGMEYQGTIQSPCYQRGTMTCLSCHSMHDAQPDDQLRVPDHAQSHAQATNANCVQCHEEFRDQQLIERHTHHAPNSSGSQCLNCHMPFQAYGLLKAVRSHEISSPNVAASLAGQRPSACTQCHVDKSFQWAATRLQDWYDIEVPQLTADQQRHSATLLDLLQGHALQRALAASNLGWTDADAASPGDWRVPLLLAALDDSYAAVRHIALESLRKTRGWEKAEFNHLASAGDRRRQIESLRKRSSYFSSDSNALPIDGSPNAADIKRLLKSQDATEIMILE